MRLHALRPHPASIRKPRRVGRGIGSGYGKTAGRGHKGQKSRSGGYHKVGFEGGQMPLQRRLPKLGFRSRIGKKTAEVRLFELDRLKETVIDLAVLKKAGLVARNIERASIILKGGIGRSVTIEGLRVSRGARQAIEALGGKVVESGTV